jgi:hypothetical protein
MNEINAKLSDLNRSINFFLAKKDAGENPTARDWAGFFQALADFAAVIIPLIQSFFLKKPTV